MWFIPDQTSLMGHKSYAVLKTLVWQFFSLANTKLATACGNAACSHHFWMKLVIKNIADDNYGDNDARHPFLILISVIE